MNSRSARGAAGRLFGELLIIVMGVLIAFWVEDYRQGRQDRVEERILLEALQREYAGNRIALDRRLATYDSRRKAQAKLMELGSDAADLPVDSATVLWASAVRGGSLDLADGALNSALGGGALSLIQDPELREMIARWPSQVENFKDVDEIYAVFRQDVLVQFLAPRIDAPPFGGLNAIPLGVKADRDYRAVLGTPEFNRLLTWAIAHHDIYRVVSGPFYQLLDETEARLAEALGG